jgi:hypothetical protein
MPGRQLPLRERLAFPEIRGKLAVVSTSDFFFPQEGDQ